MTTLYLSPRYTEDSQLLWKAAIKLDWDVQRLSWNQMDDFFGPGVTAPIVYGETSFTSLAAEKAKIQLYDPPSTFLMDLQRKYDLTCHINRKYNEKEEEVDFLLRRVYNYRYFNPPEVDDGRIVLGRYSVYPVKPLFNPDDPPKSFLNTPKFVKPVEKGQFVPGVFNDPIAQIQTLPHNTEVIVSDPVEWEVEFRAFISGHKVRTISPYCRRGELITVIEHAASSEEWEKAEAFANKVASMYREPFVVDVGYMTHPGAKVSGWAVVEANPAWGAGIYGCDPIEALKVIKEACNVKD